MSELCLNFLIKTFKKQKKSIFLIILHKRNITLSLVINKKSSKHKYCEPLKIL